jgi:hypothetical protein
MLAGEFLLFARFFDRLEVRLRRLGRWVKGRWVVSSTATQTLSVLTIQVCVAALGYRLFFWAMTVFLPVAVMR